MITVYRVASFIYLAAFGCGRRSVLPQSAKIPLSDMAVGVTRTPTGCARRANVVV